MLYFDPGRRRLLTPEFGRHRRAGSQLLRFLAAALAPGPRADSLPSSEHLRRDLGLPPAGTGERDGFPPSVWRTIR